MAQVSLKLTPEDIGAVSAWLASRWDIRTRRNRPAR
ncbi:cytochrome C [Bordetella pertussis]|nr:cytochrome C [Bordetella pertussis]